MALVVKDRVRETSTSAGTGDIILNGAVTGFQSFTEIGDANTTYYTIVDAATGQFEVGIGTYTLATTTLSRDTILESSAGGAAVDFTINIKDVFVTYPAERSVDSETPQTLTNKTLTSPAISSPTVTGDLSIADKIVHTGDTDTALRFPANDTVTVETNGAERVRVNSDGNVGIGTSSPRDALDMGTGSIAFNSLGKLSFRAGNNNTFANIVDFPELTTANATIRFLRATNTTGSKSIMFFKGDGTNTRDAQIGVDGAGTFFNSGNVGIGTTSPEHVLDITATDNVVTNIAFSIQQAARNYGVGLGPRLFTNRNIGGTVTTLDYTFDIGGPAIFKTADAERLRIDSSGRVGIGSSSPGGVFSALDIVGSDGRISLANNNNDETSKFSRLTARPFTNSNRNTYTVGSFNTATDNEVLIGGGSGVLAQANIIKMFTASGRDTAGFTERMRINSSGNVGIGTSSPSARLEVSTDALIHGATVGRGGGAITTNTAVGFGALSSNTTGVENTANGGNALRENTTGNFNTANGQEALLSNTTGRLNTANSTAALRENTIGNENTANGVSALRENTTGSFNTANGRDAMRVSTTGSQNTAVGRRALRDNTTGSNNIGIGFEAGRSTSPRTITTQSNEICIGNNDHTGAFIRISFTVTSDARDKAALAPIPHGLDFVNALLPTEYQFKAGGRDGVADGHRRYGFLAQDVLAAEGENPVIINDDDPDSLKMTSDYLIPVLVNAMKELTEQVNTLKAEVATLKGN